MLLTLELADLGVDAVDRELLEPVGQFTRLVLDNQQEIRYLGEAVAEPGDGPGTPDAVFSQHALGGLAAQGLFGAEHPRLVVAVERSRRTRAPTLRRHLGIASQFRATIPRGPTKAVALSWLGSDDTDQNISVRSTSAGG